MGGGGGGGTSLMMSKGYNLINVSSYGTQVGGVWSFLISEGHDLVYVRMYKQLYPALTPCSSGLVPRAPTFDGSPFLRPRKNRGAAVSLPGMGQVKLRPGSTHTPLHNFDPRNIPDDLMSLEDFLAESEKTPNRVSEGVVWVCGNVLL